MSGASSDDDDMPELQLLVAPQLAPASLPPPPSGAQPATETTDAPAPVPVTLITGYLGAGKTTLVNYILTAKHGCRCAVLLNEIGDSADVERALVKEPEGSEAAAMDEWVTVENGCICCSSKNDMVKALEALMQQRDRFDYVVIETTGLANPGPVAAALWTDAELESSICLDAVVTVVDAKNILRQLRDQPGRNAEAQPGAEASVNEAQQQLAFADVVLLNKVDLVSPAQLQEIMREIAAVNGDARVLPCQRCQVDLGHILNTGIYSGTLAGPAAGPQPTPLPKASVGDSTAVPAAPQQRDGQATDLAVEEACCGHAASEQEAGAADIDTGHHAPACSLHGAGCSGGHGPQHQQGLDAATQVRTLSILLPDRPLQLERLRHWLDDLLWEERTPDRPDILRVKGLLWVQGSPHKHVCQAVYDIYDVVEGPAWQSDERRFSKLVFIGRRLDRAALAAQLGDWLADNGDM
ncbi:hypothetical protein N2152v2_007656 [Parachlorella kessleri]